MKKYKKYNKYKKVNICLQCTQEQEQQELEQQEWEQQEQKSHWYSTAVLKRVIGIAQLCLSAVLKIKDSYYAHTTIHAFLS